MLTVPGRTETIRNRHVAAGALIFGVTAALLLVCAQQAGAQELGPLRGEAAGQAAAEAVTVDDAAETDAGEETVATALPAPDFEDMPGRARAVEPVAPVQGTGGVPEDDPFAPAGIRFGSFILRPSAEIGVAGSRETTGSASAVDRVLGDTALRLDLESDWDRHAVTVTADGRMQKPLNGGESEPELSVTATGRLDITDGTTLTGSLGYAYALDDPQSAAYLAATDPALVPAVTGTNDPAVQVFDGSVALRQEFGALFGETELSAERAIYGDAKLSDGMTVSQHDLDNTLYDARLRAGIEVSPVLSPFVEVSWGLRRMDTAPDSGGIDRNATRYGLRGGAAIDFGEKLNGEIAAGYIKEDIADAALTDLAGVAVDAALNWSPRRGTDLALTLATTTETGGSAGDSGALLYSADLGVTHEARADLTLEAGFGTEYRDEQGGADELTLSGSAALTYWFNRFTGLTTRIGHERTTSSDPASRSETTTAFVGLKLQR